MIRRRYAFVLLIILLLGACSQKESSKCDRPPEDFSVSELIGTWGGSVETPWDSTIIIREDGRYKQILNIKRTGFHYESDWLSWRVTYSDKGLPYLHMKGLLMCAYWNQIDCSTGKTDIEPAKVGDTMDPLTDKDVWYDGCQKKWVHTSGEGVFMILEGSVSSQRNFSLVPFTKLGDAPSTWYEMREP